MIVHVFGVRGAVAFLQALLVLRQRLKLAGRQHARRQFHPLADCQQHMAVIGRAARREGGVHRRVEAQHERHRLVAFVDGVHLLAQTIGGQRVRQGQGKRMREIAVVRVRRAENVLDRDKTFVGVAAVIRRLPRLIVHKSVQVVVRLGLVYRKPVRSAVPVKFPVLVTIRRKKHGNAVHHRPLFEFGPFLGRRFPQELKIALIVTERDEIAAHARQHDRRIFSELEQNRRFSPVRALLCVIFTHTRSSIPFQIELPLSYSDALFDFNLVFLFC